MNSPPAARPAPTVSAVPSQAQGRRVQVRSDDGSERIRAVSVERALDLIEAGLARWRGKDLWLRVGIRWIQELDFANGVPDIQRMRDHQPDRYRNNWLGGVDPHIGKGCLGRGCDNATIHMPAADPNGRGGTQARRV